LLPFASNRSRSPWRSSPAKITAVRGATSIDAIVMASAAQRGDVVYTSDVEDLGRLSRFFPAVRVLGVG
jgi:hypothetical protein